MGLDRGDGRRPDDITVFPFRHERSFLTNSPALGRHWSYYDIYLKCSIIPKPIYLNILIGPTVCRLNRYWPNSKLGDRPITRKIVIGPVKINDVEFRVVSVVMKRKFANGGPITVCLSGWFGTAPAWTRMRRHI